MGRPEYGAARPSRVKHWMPPSAEKSLTNRHPERDDPKVRVSGDKVGRVFAVLRHEFVSTRRNDVRPVFEVHLAVLEEVVQEREDPPLDALDPVEDEDFAFFRGADRSAVGVLEDAARPDLPALLQLGLADVAMQDADLERLVQEVEESEGEAAREVPRRRKQEHVLACAPYFPVSRTNLGKQNLETDLRSSYFFMSQRISAATAGSR